MCRSKVNKIILTLAFLRFIKVISKVFITWRVLNSMCCKPQTNIRNEPNYSQIYLFCAMDSKVISTFQHFQIELKY